MVDPGGEFQLSIGNLGAFFEVDIDADSLTLRYIHHGGLTQGDPDVFSFGGLLAATGINNFTSSGVSGVERSDFWLSDGVLTASLSNASFDPGSWALISFDVLMTSVPEPGTLALLGLGLVGMGYARRRKAA